MELIHWNTLSIVEDNKHIFKPKLLVTAITRGCYSGQYKVDPDRLGCHHQGDNKELYCFCQGDHCNGGSMSVSHRDSHRDSHRPSHYDEY